MTKEEIEALAHKLYIDLTSEELEDLYNEFNYITERMEIINNIEGIDEVSPMHMVPYKDKVFLREDKEEGSLEKTDVLKNSKSVLEDSIKVPKVVE